MQAPPQAVIKSITSYHEAQKSNYSVPRGILKNAEESRPECAPKTLSVYKHKGGVGEGHLSRRAFGSDLPLPSRCWCFLSFSSFCGP